MRKTLSDNKTLIIVGLAIFIVSIFLRVWRISYAPDIHGDEIIYNVISNNLLTKGELSYRNGTWFTHPPLYYIFLAGYLFVNSQSAVTLDSIFIARTLNAILLSIAIIVTFLLVSKMKDLRTATIVSVLLMLDPYLIKFSRIGMLEPAALMFIVLTIYLFYNAEMSESIRRYVLAGTFMGMSFLTKDITAYMIFGFIIYIIISYIVFKTKINFRGYLIFLGTAIFIYMIYVAWGWFTDIDSFLASKIYLIKRITGIIIDTGYLREGYASLYADIVDTFWIYGTSHILVLMSIPSSFYLLFKDRKKGTILLTSWLYISFIFLFIIRIRNPQFYCYIIFPAIILDGIALSSIIKKPYFTVSKDRIYSVIGMIILLLTISYNGYVWTNMYGIGTDDAYMKTINYIKSDIRKGETLFIIPTSRPLLIDYPIIFGYYSISGLKDRGINYVIISPRYYHMINSKTLEYILRNGKLIKSFEGHSLRRVDIYVI